ncbi:hypothetical protein [Nocardia takedensis]|uniref:hypothetical protein n=1 Tax=Nocardia takedensis TaxID=259390 RepID=UPI000316449D|nr:hypothetical protein [Nocardia takedensis]
MTEYRVVWQIDVDAHDPTSAALVADELLRASDSTATVFDVLSPDQHSHRVDLRDRPA